MNYSLGNMLSGSNGGLNPDKLSLNLQFATDKTLTARKGPTPTFTRASNATYYGPLIQASGGNYVISTIGFSNGRALWEGNTGPIVSVFYTGTQWKLTETYSDDTYEYFAAAGNEWRPDQANWSGSGTTVTTSSTFGIIRSAINEPRFDHNPTTLASLGLLIEESRTNLTKRSDNDFSNAYWNSTANNVTAVDSVTTSPTGVASTASSITEIAGVSVTRHIHQTTGEFTPAASSAYTMSAWVKQPPTNPVRYVQLAFWVAGFGSTAYMNYDIQTGAVGTGGAGITASSIVAYPDGWYRISATATSLASPGSSGFQLGFSTTSGAVRTEAYTVVSPLKSIYLWGAQVELGAFPTSYIPTTTASVVRSVDVCSITGAAFTGFYNQSEGTMLSQSTKVSTNTNAFIVYASGGSFVNGLDLRYTSTTLIAASMNVASAAQLTGLQATITSGSSPKQAVAYKLNDCAYSANGAAAITDTSALIPTVSQLNIGLSHNSSQQPLNGHIASIRYFKKRLANAKLQTLTA
jgi:hypothetical protein